MDTTTRLAKMKDAVRILLKGIGEDPEREGLFDTPKRVAKALLDASSGYLKSPEEVLGNAFFNEPIVERGGSGIVLVREIDFASTSATTLLPFHGRVHIAYIPSNGVVLGLSKLARLTQLFSKRLQTPATLAHDIAAALQRYLGCCGVATLIVSKQLALAGSLPPSETLVGCTSGAFNAQPANLEEVLCMLGLDTAFREELRRICPLEAASKYASKMLQCQQSPTHLQAENQEGCYNKKDQPHLGSFPQPPTPTKGQVETPICQSPSCLPQALPPSAALFTQPREAYTHSSPPSSTMTQPGLEHTGDPQHQPSQSAAGESLHKDVMCQQGKTQLQTQPKQWPCSESSRLGEEVPCAPCRCCMSQCESMGSVLQPLEDGNSSESTSDVESFSTSGSRPPSPPGEWGSGVVAEMQEGAVVLVTEMLGGAVELFSPKDLSRAAHLYVNTLLSSTSGYASKLLSQQSQECKERGPQPTQPKTRESQSSEQDAADHTGGTDGGINSQLSDACLHTHHQHKNHWTPQSQQMVTQGQKQQQGEEIGSSIGDSGGEGKQQQQHLNTGAVGGSEVPCSPLFFTFPFNSQCEHHMLPFYGTAHFMIWGAQGSPKPLSRSHFSHTLEQAVHAVTQRLQVQERITHQLAEEAMSMVHACMAGGACMGKGSMSVVVVVDAQHMCMVARGVENHAGATTTVAARGGAVENAVLRLEAVKAARARGGLGRREGRGG